MKVRIPYTDSYYKGIVPVLLRVVWSLRKATIRHLRVSSLRFRVVLVSGLIPAFPTSKSTTLCVISLHSMASKALLVGGFEIPSESKSQPYPCTSHLLWSPSGS